MILTRSHNDAEDILQDCMIRAWRARQAHDPKKGSVYNWLDRILVNCYRDFARKRARRPMEVELYCEDDDGDIRSWDISGPETDQPDVVLDMQQTSEHIAEALTRMRPLYREVLLMSARGYSYEELARLWSVPSGTVKSRLFRARKEAQFLLRQIVR